MNQTRVFLIFAWLMVAALLWMEWGKDKAAANAPVAAATQSVPAARDLDAAATAANVPAAQAIPQAGAPGAVPATSTTAATPAAAGAAPVITLTSDVLRLKLDGRSVLDAELLQFPQTKDGTAPVSLLTEDAAHPYNATSGWASEHSPVPGVGGFRAEQPGTAFALAKGQNTLVVPFVWMAPTACRSAAPSPWNAGATRSRSRTR